jgi:hypothetical protein
VESPIRLELSSRKQPKSLCIPLKIAEIKLLSIRQSRDLTCPERRAKEPPDSVFARMTERWITNIVRETPDCHDPTDIMVIELSANPMTLTNGMPYRLSQGPSDRSDFQAVSQA